MKKRSLFNFHGKVTSAMFLLCPAYNVAYSR